MHQMLDTSLEAYAEILKTLTEKQKKVLELLKKEYVLPVCNWQIALLLHWPINCVTGRIKELRKKGLVVDDGKHPGPPEGRNVHYWRPVKTETLFREVRNDHQAIT